MAVVEVLREAVAQQDHMFGARAYVLELLAHVTNRRAHAGRSLGFHRTDARLDLVGQPLVELLDDVELDVVAAVAGETHDRVGVADFLERLRP